ncbi:MAG: DegT/DnrJ/EryC1/StrS family aminotransferase [Treponema sp.]|jgi:dTDP-4-amino-4,6-dideoxygalactose transaminase|nr:DegT/DnrJ/EryC1/StrS family aminotransferase [Treponema sp.]
MTDIPFARPFIGEEEEQAVLRVLRSGWLTTGEEALAFEKEFARFLAEDTAPLPCCLAVNSATSGLHLALEALGIGPGSLVLLPSYTFTSTAEVVRYLGAESVFVDIAPNSGNMDPSALEYTLSRLESGKAVPGFRGAASRPKAVIPVHFGGLPCDMASIMHIARKRGLGVVEDSAHAFPARCPFPAPDTGAVQRWAGTIGDAGVFSFYATKTITTGEGGMLVTFDTKIAERAACMRSHGIDRPVWNRYADTKASWYYEVTAPGYKYNLPDLLAAVGRAQLSRASFLLSRRREIARRYDRAFGGVPGLVIPPTSPGDARHLYPLRIAGGAEPAPGAGTESRRDAFIRRLKENGVGASVHFIPLHIMPYYKNRYTLSAGDFPETYKRYRETVSLPIWPGMTAEETERVIAVVLENAEKTGIH